MLKCSETGMTAADVLRAAADKIMRDGHAKGTYGSGDGLPSCVRGACMAAGGGLSNVGTSVYWEARHAVDGAVAGLATSVPACTWSAIVWNDAPERTAEEVIDLLLTTAAELEAASFQSNMTDADYLRAAYDAYDDAPGEGCIKLLNAVRIAEFGHCGEFSILWNDRMMGRFSRYPDFRYNEPEILLAAAAEIEAEDGQ